MEHTIRINAIEELTHDVKRFQCEKPADYHFIPGQATEVSINKEGWRAEKRPFTFTSLNGSADLEFVIKIYNDHTGVTSKLNDLVPGDELIVGDVWGAIEYKGPGYFIAGGCGITPFIAVFRQLKLLNTLEGNKLLFSNKTHGDIILEKELSSMLGDNVIYTITREQSSSHHTGKIDKLFLIHHIEDFNKNFYLCGPQKMVDILGDVLVKLGASAEAIVLEN